jgi:FkbM family methyltransferase
MMLKLVAHHVGARGFGVSFNVPDAFRSEVAHVLYEADAQCVERMLRDTDSAMARALAEKHVLPYCLGRQRGRASLNITANSYASSIFPPNPDFSRYYCEIPIDAAIYDVAYREMLEVVRQADVEVHSLDKLFDEGKIPIAAQPDILSLDTQGYELEILEGAQKTLSQGVLAVVSEVEMIPMYSGQPLLGDVLNFMTRQGFIFAGFTAMYEVSPHRAPIGFRGKAFPGFGDALFLRDVTTLTEGPFPVDQLYVMAVKLAFISICFGYVEYSLSSMVAAQRVRDRVTPELRAKVRRMKYAQFLEAVERLATTPGGLFPPLYAMPDEARATGDFRTSWYDRYHKAALNRFHTVAAAAGSPVPGDAASALRRLVGAMRRVPGGNRLLSSRVARVARRILGWGFSAPYTTAAPATSTSNQAMSHPWVSIQAHTEFEKCLNEWGFASLALVVQQRRLPAEQYLQALEPEMYAAGFQVHLPGSGGPPSDRILK